NLQLPIKQKLALGIFLLSDKSGLLTSYQGDIGLSYLVRLGATSNLSFGLGAGMERNTIDPTVVDNALVNARGTQLTGQFGLNLQIRKLSFAFALPKLLETDLLEEFNIEQTGLAALKTTFSSIGFQFDVGSQFVLKPTIYYLTDLTSVDQYGGLASITYNDLVWLGGGYKEDLGANAFLGFNIKEFIQVGYAYEFATNIADKTGNGTHEIHLRIRLGKTNKRQYTVESKVEPITITPVEETFVEPKPLEEESTVQEEFKEQPKEEQINLPEPAEQQVADIPNMNENIKEELLQEEAEVAINEKVTNVESDHSGEMPPGYYIVVGAFSNRANAQQYLERVRAAGFGGSLGSNQKSGFNYVYLNFIDSLDAAKTRRDEIREINQFEFPNAWILRIR
ncbi:MAG: PorP/SprF family type IX secretion system membrane protein, partial [Cyclobacteriaceae bacterium]